LPLKVLAKTVDVVIISVGIDTSIEQEGFDRTYIGLPDTQQELLQQVSQAAKGLVIVVLNNGGPLSSDYLAQTTKGATPSVHARCSCFEKNPLDDASVIRNVYLGKHGSRGNADSCYFK
jgi:hypothetical protein